MWGDARDASVVLNASSSRPERISRLAPASKRSPDVSAKHPSDTLFTLTGAKVKHHPSKHHPGPSKTRAQYRCNLRTFSPIRTPPRRSKAQEGR